MSLSSHYPISHIVLTLYTIFQVLPGNGRKRFAMRLPMVVAAGVHKVPYLELSKELVDAYSASSLLVYRYDSKAGCSRIMFREKTS